MSTTRIARPVAARIPARSWFGFSAIGFRPASRRIGMLVAAAGILFGAWPQPAMAVAPAVSNVVAAQRPGTLLVDVTYDLFDADGDSMKVALFLSEDGGATFPIECVTVVGDVGEGVMSGTGLRIEWNAGVDYPGHEGDGYLVKVTADDIHSGMLWVPPGLVRMGKAGMAEPVHDFFVEGFYIDAREVTNRQYMEFMDAGGYHTEGWWNPVGWEWRSYYDLTEPATWGNPYYHGGGLPGTEEFPVNGISWWEADAYSRWAGKRLPTEAEWEKAAKGGCERWGDPGACDPSDTPTYPWGEGVSGPQANYVGSGDPYESDGRTTPVGYYDGSVHDGYQTQDSPGPYGIYDVVGNVYEWCSSEWKAYPYDPGDGREEPPEYWSGSLRVLRGGAWETYAHSSSKRDYGNPNGRHGGLGFRCASTN